MVSSESASDSDSSASKRTTISVEQTVIDENERESDIDHEPTSAKSTTATSATTRKTSADITLAPSTSTSTTSSSSPTRSAPTSPAIAGPEAPQASTSTKMITETLVAYTTKSDPTDRGDIGSYIDDLIRKNEAIVENCPLTNIRPYKQSASKTGDNDTQSGSQSKTNFPLSENTTTATLSQIIKSNNHQAAQRNLSTTSSSSSSSSSTASNNQVKQASTSQLVTNVNNITTTTAPSKRKSTPCLITPTNLSNNVGPFPSHINQAQSNNVGSTVAATVAAATAYGLMQKAANLRSISEYRDSQRSSLFTSNFNAENQFQISQHQNQQQSTQNNNHNSNINNNTSWPSTSRTDYPSDSTGYSSAGSLSHQSSICDTNIFSDTAQTNPLPTSISAFIAHSLPSITAAISAASTTNVPPSTSASTSASISSTSAATATTATATFANNNYDDNNNRARNHPKTITSLSSSFSNQPAEQRSRRRSYEVRNRDFLINYSNIQQASATSSASNPFGSNMPTSMAASTSQANSSNRSQLFTFSQLPEQQTQTINFAMQQHHHHHHQQQQQAMDTGSTEFKMALIKEKMAALSRQQDCLQLELEEQERKHEQQQQQHQQHLQLQNQQNHITNLSALVNGDNQYLELLRHQFLQRQLPTTEHSAELLTQSLDSATPAYKCQLCNMSFWTKALLNYHHATQCPSIISLLGLNLVNQHQQERSQLHNNTRDFLNLQQQLQQLEMTGDLSNGEMGGSVSPGKPHRQPPVSKSVSPRAKSHILRPDLSPLNVNPMQQHQQEQQLQQQQNPNSSSNVHNHREALRLFRQPSIKIDQPDDDISSNQFLNRSLSPLASSSNSNPKHRNRNNSDSVRRCINEASVINATSGLTPTTSSSSSLSLGSDISGCHQLRPNSASMTSTINNGVSIGNSNDDNGNNNLGLANTLPLKKRKISAPGFI